MPKFFVFFFQLLLLILSDITVAVAPVLRQGLPIPWVDNERYGTRKWIILLWVSTAFILTAAYMSTLLSTLVPLRYEKPVETIQDAIDRQLN